MRTVNSLKNIITGVSGQLLMIILQFASRTVFIYILGIEYLGISGLFTNILQVLNMTELGIGTAIVYSLYKPLAENDTKKVLVILGFLKKAYFIVGLVIAGLGLVLMPFLPYIIKDTNDLVNINVIYLLYLLQSVLSYWFFAYKTLLLQADQKKYIANSVRYLITVLTVLAQIVILIWLKSFMIYIVIGIIFNVIINFVISRKVDKLYPYINKPNKEEFLSENERRQIFKNLFGVSVYKINSVVLRSTDSIVISSFIGIATVGIYSNYQLIVSTLITLAKMIFSSFTASVGNLFVLESKGKNIFIFRCLSFVGFWLYGFCAICLWILFNPFITLWVGSEYLLEKYIVLAIVINFLMDGYQQVVISYKDACGLFWQGKYRPVATAILNIIISIVLAPRMGVAGVLLGTIISRFLTTWWFEPWMVHKYAFDTSSKSYFFRYMGFSFLIVITAAVVQVASLPFSDNTWLNFILKMVLCCLIPNGVFFILFRKTEEYRYLLKSSKQIIKSLKRKNKQRTRSW